MEIKTVSFVKSSSDWQQCPPANLPEYAFIGRSNVGKSSLINSMLKRNNLAKTSGTPGKTQLINHFLINETWYLTDLPGYGYAKVSKGQRKDFEKLITGYVLNRKNLVNLFILVDARHAPQKIDLEFMEWCAESQIPFCIIFTKSDKVKTTQLQQKIDSYKNRLLEEWESLPNLFLTSAEKKTGTDEILDNIEETNQMLIKNKVRFV